MRKYRIQTHYEVLEVSVSASTQDIDAAYARLSKLYTDDQPALYGLVEAGRMGELRAQLTAAHEVLRDDARRDAYDLTLGLPPRDPPAVSPQVALPPEALASSAMAPAVDVASKEAEEAPPPAAPATSVAEPQAPVVVAAAVAASLETEKPVTAQAAVPVVASEAPTAATTAAGPVEADAPEPVAEAAGRPAELAEAAPAAVSEAPAALASPDVSPGASEATAPAAPSSPRESPVDPPARLSDDAEVSLVLAAPPPVKEHRLPEPRPRPHEVPPGVEFNGGLLRQVRMAQGVSLHQLSERTRIGARHLENLEADRYDQLPASVYLRGILMNVARELGLDGLRVARSYLQFVDAARPKG